jgi:drug/metabolite transporter (DMT)-like permease
MTKTTRTAGGTRQVIGKNRMRDAEYRLGLLLVTASAVAWSTAGLFTRIIEVDTGTMLFWRGMFGALGILVIALAMQGRKALTDFAKMGVPGWVFAIISALGMLCFITSLRLTTVAHVSFIYATVPLVAAVLAWLVIGERPGRSALFASFASLFGVAIIVGLGIEGNMLGDLLAFGMTLALAIMMVISRRYRNIPTMPAACVSAILSAMMALPFATDLGVSLPDLGLLAAFGLVNSAIGLALFTLGARLLPAIETALIGAVETPLAPAWVWIIFAEIPSAPTLFGGAVVLTAVLAHILYQNRRSSV